MTTQIKKEQKSDIKGIQLAKRDVALWKHKEKGMILMSQMEDEHLCKALTVVQNRQMRSFDMLQMDFKLEQQLKAEAKARGLEIRDYDEVVKNNFSKRYGKAKELLRLIAAYIKKKQNDLKKEKI